MDELASGSSRRRAGWAPGPLLPLGVFPGCPLPALCCRRHVFLPVTACPSSYPTVAAATLHSLLTHSVGFSLVFDLMGVCVVNEEFAPLLSALVLPASVFMLVCSRASCLFRHEPCGLSRAGLPRPRRAAAVRGPPWFRRPLSGPCSSPCLLVSAARATPSVLPSRPERRSVTSRALVP